MGLDPVRALIPTQRLGVDVTFTGKLPAPAARAGKADPEAFGCLVPGRAGLDGSHHALAQITRTGLRTSALSFANQPLSPEALPDRSDAALGH